MDEAYRRLGHRLSRRAHGDQPLTRPLRHESLGLTPTSVFGRYERQSIGGEGGGNDPAHLGNGDGAASVDVSKDDMPFGHISNSCVDGRE